MSVLHTLVGYVTLPPRLVPMDIPNPLDGVEPTLGPFKAALGSKVTMILALVWFLCIAGAVCYLIVGIVGFARARKERRPDAVSDGAADIGFPAGALILLGIAPLIVNALI